jgi:hypothetical protein
MTLQPIMIPGLGSKSNFEEVILTEAQKKMAVAIGSVFQEPEMNLSFQKALEMGWIRLWDLQPVTPNPMLPVGKDNMPVLARIFKITNTGSERLREIQRRKEIDKRIPKQ